MTTLHVLFVVLILKAAFASPPLTPDKSKKDDEKKVSTFIPSDSSEELKTSTLNTIKLTSTLTPTDSSEDRSTQKPPTDDATAIPNVPLETKKNCQCYIESLPKDVSTTCPGDDKKDTDEYKANKEFCESILKFHEKDTETTVKPASTEQPSLSSLNTEICSKYINKKESESTITEKELKLICDVIAKVLEKENQATTPTTTDITEKPKEDIFSIAEEICPCYDTTFNDTNCTVPAETIQSNVTSYNHMKKICEAIRKINKSSIPKYNAEVATKNPLSSTTAGTKEDDNLWLKASSVYKDVCPCYGVPKAKDGNKTATCNKYPKGLKKKSTKAEHADIKLLCEQLQKAFGQKKAGSETPTSTITRASSTTPATVTVSSKEKAPSKEKYYSLGTVLGWSFGSVLIGVGAAMGALLLYKRYKGPY